MSPRHLLALLLPLLLPGSAAAEPWEQDFTALKQALSRDYANFAHAVETQRLDLPAIASPAEAELATATTPEARRGTVERMLGRFNDPHLAALPLAQPVDFPGSYCLPYLESDTSGTVARSADTAPLPGAEPFEGRIGRTPAGRRIAILRLASFVPAEWPSCPSALAAAGIHPDTPCESACADREEAVLKAHMSAALPRAVRAAEAARVDAILFDLTGNGGGGDWAVTAARQLGAPRAAGLKLARSPKVERWARARETEAVAAGRTADAMLAARIAREAADRCDLAAAWTAKPGTPLSCPSLTATASYAGGWADPTDATPADAKPAIPLLVAIDFATASSAELFAAQLRDNDAARLIGTRTSGAGCGQRTGGGNHIDLPALGTRVIMPDCVRLRADGSNERNGIAPDHLLDIGPSLSLHQRAALFLEGVDRMLAR
jgi:hypothetical protein